MIHLKRFNEKIQWNRDRPELLKFCEEHLAYLLDEGFDIYVRLHKMENSAYKNGIRDEGYISICYKKHPNTFKWNRIKDEFIPFLEMLIIKYNLAQDELKVTLLYGSGMMRVFSGDNINTLDSNLISRGNLEEIRVETK